MIQFRSKYSNKVNEETVSNYEKKKKWYHKSYIFVIIKFLRFIGPESCRLAIWWVQILAGNGMMNKKTVRF